MVYDWLKHMDEWTQENSPWGISALVLQRPNMPYGNAVFILKSSDVGRLQERMNKSNVIVKGKAFIRSDNGNGIYIHNSVGEEKRIKWEEIDDHVIENFIHFLTHLKSE